MCPGAWAAAPAWHSPACKLTQNPTRRAGSCQAPLPLGQQVGTAAATCTHAVQHSAGSASSCHLTRCIAHRRMLTCCQRAAHTCGAVQPAEVRNTVGAQVQHRACQASMRRCSPPCTRPTSGSRASRCVPHARTHSLPVMCSHSLARTQLSALSLPAAPHRAGARQVHAQPAGVEAGSGRARARVLLRPGAQAHHIHQGWVHTRARAAGCPVPTPC